MATREALAEIRSIVEDIKRGRKEHNQQYYHSDCGTSHCIAGWKQVIDLVKLGTEPTYFNFRGSWNINRSEYINPNPWDYAKNKWQLTHREACSLFSFHLDLEEIDSNLTELEKKYE